MKKRWIFMALLALAPRLKAEEVEPLATDRPDTTETPFVVPRGMIQIESGYTYTREGDDRQHALGEVLVRVPVSRKAELRFGVPSYLWQRSGGPARGFEEASLGAKFVLSPGGGKKPATALLISTPLPTGRAALSENAYQPEAALAALWEVNEKTAFTTNLAYARARDGGVRFNQFRATGSFGVALTEKLGAFAEAFIVSKADASGRSAKYANTGLTYLINPNFQLDVRAGIGLNNNAGGPDYFVGAGVSRRF
jgi:hypothetical protein